ncbi:MAG: ribosomal-protein-alanine N-acetyltransferase [Gammaproteobacteria bacterium]|jgi:ribosomal-protein-alanine N-acetyltransferase|nr:ribosomal-protein-alanine N-acetyltransferase [Gammaproteobacteria bacterium]
MSLDISTRMSQTTKPINISFKELNTEFDQEISLIESRIHRNPWSQEQIKESFQNKNNLVIGVFNQDELIGYCFILIAQTEAEILNIAIDINFQRKGLGEILLKECFERLKSQQAKNLFLEVRESNHAAKNLYSKMGFKTIGIRKNYYSDNEDANMMQLIF